MRYMSVLVDTNIMHVGFSGSAICRWYTVMGMIVLFTPSLVADGGPHYAIPPTKTHIVNMDRDDGTFNVGQTQRLACIDTMAAEPNVKFMGTLWIYHETKKRTFIIYNEGILAERFRGRFYLDRSVANDYALIISETKETDAGVYECSLIYTIRKTSYTNYTIINTYIHIAAPPTLFSPRRSNNHVVATDTILTILSVVVMLASCVMLVSCLMYLCKVCCCQATHTSKMVRTDAQVP
jgi:hypothetical protein